MDEREMRERVSGARVARLATIRADGRPHLVPVCFALTGDTVVSGVDAKPKSTRWLRRLENVRANPAVTLLVDHYEEQWDRVWWVRLDGTGHVVEDGPAHARAIAALRDKYAQYATIALAGAVLVIDDLRWRGWAYSG